MRTGAKGVALIKRKEEFRARAYVCPAGKLTIGYGHVLAANEGHLKGAVLTEAQASALLLRYLERYERAVSQAVRVPLSQAQFDALVCLCYNIGAAGFAGSGLVKCLNAKATADDVRRHWVAWNKMDGTRNRRDDDGDGLVDEPGEKQVAPGLVARRAEESDLYFRG